MDNPDLVVEVVVILRQGANTPHPQPTTGQQLVINIDNESQLSIEAYLHQIRVF